MIKINNKVVPEGYELVWEKPENTLYKDCMVVVESVALIKRKKVHGFYVRCAFRSLNEKAISALKVGFSLKDEAGNTVCSVEDYQYDGFDTARGSIFGQTFAIPVKTEEENEADKIKFEDIFNSYKKTMYYIANSILKDEHYSHDAVQNSF